MELTSEEGSLKWFELNELSKLEMPLSAKLMIEHYLAIGRKTNKIYVGTIDNSKGVFTELSET